MTQEQSGSIDKDPAPPPDADWHKAIFDCSPNAIVLTEVATGKVRTANPAACRMLGYTEAQLCGIDRSALFGSDDPDLPGALAKRGLRQSHARSSSMVSSWPGAPTAVRFPSS